MKRNLIIFFSLLFLVTGIWSVQYFGQNRQLEPILIAFALPLTGVDAKAGKTALDGVRLFVDRLNRKGGIAGRQIKIELFDDQNLPEVAAANALKIAAQSRALAVIGHYSDDATSVAGEVYQDNGILAITPSARGEYTVYENPWLFRNINSVSIQASFLLHYLGKVIEQNAFTLLSEQHPLGATLAEQIKNRVADPELNMTMLFDAEFDGDSEYLDLELEDLMESLPYPEDAGVILISARAHVGVVIVKTLRDAGFSNIIIGPDSFTSGIFSEGFNDYPAEQIYPGYYTNQIVSVADLVYDSANKAARDFRDDFLRRYQREPEQIAAFSFDAIKLLTFAIEKSGIATSAIPLQQARVQLRDFLAAMDSPEFAMNGITGYTFFNEEGEVLKDTTVGVYKSKRLISLFTQLRNIRYLNEISNLEKEMDAGNVLTVDERFLFRTRIIKTGIQINEITEIDLNKLTCTIDFDIWFRYQGDTDITQITFHNAEEPVELSDPITIRDEGPTRYALFKIKQSFKLDYLDYGFNFNRHIVSLSFHHKNLTLNNLLYVPDIVGMGISTGMTLEDQMIKRRVIGPEEGWDITGVSFYADIAEEYPLGRPEYLSLVKGVLEHSSFNMAITITKEGLNLRGSLDPESANLGFVLVIPLTLLLRFLWLRKPAFLSKLRRKFDKLDQQDHMLRREPGHSTVLLLYAASLVGFLWLFEMVLIYFLAGQSDPLFLQVIIGGFDIWWWLLPAYLLVEMIDRFFWVPLERQAGHKIPQSVRLMVSFVIYLTAIFAVIAFVFDQKLTSLLATSGMFAMIIGLAMQMNISNIFAGIAINIERPYRIGDWIDINGELEGKVVDITWRTTRILEREQNILSIPNVMASESVVRNFNYPNDVYRTTANIHIEPGHDPEVSMALLTEALNEVDRVLDKPQAFSRYKGRNGWSDEFIIAYHADNYQKKFDTDSKVMCSVWSKLSENGMNPAVHSSIVRLLKTVGGHDSRNLIPEEMDWIKPKGEK